MSTALLERHFSTKTLAELWELSEDTIQEMFRSEPGVLTVGDPKPGKRPKIMLRIPESVAERVYRRRQVK